MNGFGQTQMKSSIFGLAYMLQCKLKEFMQFALLKFQN